MFNVSATEATVKTLPFLQLQKAEICKLSGEVGRCFMRLYSQHHLGHLGLTFEAYYSQLHLSYHIGLSSSIKESRLLKGDGVVFHFEDGSYINGRFTTGKHDMDGEAHNSIMLDNAQVHQFLDCPLSHISLLSKKTNNSIDCQLTAHGSNVHYNSKGQGQKLIHIMLQRVIGAAMLMTGKNEVNEIIPESHRLPRHQKLDIPDNPTRYSDDGTRRGHGQ